MSHNRHKKKEKIEKVMSEFKSKKLHSGSKKGPIVKKKDQAVAIALSESNKIGKKMVKRAKKKKKY